MTLETWPLCKDEAKSSQPSHGVLTLSDARSLLPGKPSSVCPLQLHRHHTPTQGEAASSPSRFPACEGLGRAKNTTFPGARSPPHDDVLAASRIDARLRVSHLLSFQENASMENTKSFGQNLAGSARICWTTVQLVWKASPVLLVAVLLLFVVQSGLAPVRLALSRAVIDRLAALAGRATALDPIGTRSPLALWVALKLGVLAVAQLTAPGLPMLQSRISDRFTGHLTEQWMLAATPRQVLERLEA